MVYPTHEVKIITFLYILYIFLYFGILSTFDGASSDPGKPLGWWIADIALAAD